MAARKARTKRGAKAPTLRSRPRRRRRRGGRWAALRRRLARGWPSPKTRRRWARRASRAPIGVQLAAAVVVLLGLWGVANGIYQVLRKPTELFFPVSGVWYKTPKATWRSYAPLFRRHATSVIRPELLAALAQVEGSGNPIVRTTWRWAWRAHPFDVYRPASSAVGMYQITDGTFERARRLCIHDHQVVEEGPWYDWHSCWFNALYVRVVPSHAVEMTSAFLDRSVEGVLARYGRREIGREEETRLAALIHLCGSGWANGYVRRGLKLRPNERCGSHDARAYVRRVEGMMRRFEGLARASDGG